MKKKVLFFLLFLLVLKVYSQQRLSFDVYQDAKLALVKDDFGNTPFTIDALIMISIEFKQRKLGYYFVGQSYEYAELAGGSYRRYGFLKLGYTFTNVILKNVDISLFGDYGYVRRWGKDYVNFGFNLRPTYRISDRIQLATLFQFLRRKDIEKWSHFENKTFRYSFFAGLKINLTDIKMF